MKLYKNVDICDLQSIRENGIMSMDDVYNELGLMSWEEGKRAHNATNVVYLFQPIENGANSFPRYGAALLEIDVPDSWVEQNEIGENDYNHGKYAEFICYRSIPFECVKTVYIPNMPGKFVPESLHGMPVRFCDISGDDWEGNPMSKEQLEQFKNTVPSIQSTGVYCYFRGTDKTGKILDIYNVRYVFLEGIYELH